MSNQRLLSCRRFFFKKMIFLAIMTKLSRSSNTFFVEWKMKSPKKVVAFLFKHRETKLVNVIYSFHMSSFHKSTWSTFWNTCESHELHSCVVEFFALQLEKFWFFSFNCNLFLVRYFRFTKCNLLLVRLLNSLKNAANFSNCSKLKF